MLEETVKKAAHFFVNKLDKILPVNYYTLSELHQKLKQFQIKKVAILIDGQTDIKLLTQLEGIKIEGYYSFNLDIIGTMVNGCEIQPLLPTSNIKVGGWIISSGSELTGFSLNQYLLDNKKENQIIIHHVKYPNGTKYYSYVDFFSGGQKTVVQISNYFRRCYAIPFPLDIRLTFKDLEGNIVKVSQSIIPPDAIKVITSDDLGIKNFSGYLEIEFEISKKVMPFLHYMVDYFTPNFISSNHQSGLGLHPASSVFTRGYIPTEGDESLVICLFQRNYSEPIDIKATLYYGQNGEDFTVEKKIKPLKKNKMLYQDIKELFKKIDFSKISSPYVTIQSDVPLHRPNYYYTKKGQTGYYDTSHAGPDLNNYINGIFGRIATITVEEREKLSKYNCATMDLKHYIFPTKVGIESILALGNDTTYSIKNFTFDFYNENGDLTYSFQEYFDYDQERYLNINKYLKNKGINNFAGTLSLRPVPGEENIPILMNGIAGYKHSKNPYLTSTAASGSQPANIPFYFRGGPPDYIGGNCSTGVTDIFARGIYSDSLDTYYIISYLTSDRNLKKKIRYEIQIINATGEKKCIYKEISANGCDFLKLSDLIKETKHNSPGGYYTVWFFSSGAYLYGQHILHRKKDDAIAVEHCYVGKFGL